MSRVDAKRVLLLKIIYLYLIGLSSAGGIFDDKPSGDPFKELFNPSGIRPDDRPGFLSAPGEPDTRGPYEVCRFTETEVIGKSVCSGRKIFEENFYYIATGIWKSETRLPTNHPELPFVVYHDDTVTTVDKKLRIAPTLLTSRPGFTNESIETGKLDLVGKCTSAGHACYKQASGAQILPPIVSGRVNTRNRFAFKYGTVYVRAKLPQGDWLYPEILLEPYHSDFGDGFASGIIKIASARGNKDLFSGLTDYGNNVLYGGPVMDLQCHGGLLVSKVLRKRRMWGDDFHEFALRWEPNSITLSVDGEEYGWIEPTSTGLHTRLSNNCTNVQHGLLSSSSSMAPFNSFFYITLGVAAGGITEFPDDANTKGGHPKPWKNGGIKSMHKFWQDVDNWYPTWNQPELLVDYVKVVAL